jgi:hypothetical protein
MLCQNIAGKWVDLAKCNSLETARHLGTQIKTTYASK